MVMYLSIVFVAMIIVSLFNIVFSTGPIWFIILAVIGCTAFQFAIDGVVALIINHLPDKWFGIDKKCFLVSKKCQKFYEKLKIRKWKDKVWELGGLGGFRKNKLNDPNSKEYIEQFIIESNKVIVTLRISYFMGFLAIFLFPFKYAFIIAVPIACVNIILNILPTMILRYNIPKLRALYTRLSRQEEKDIIS